MKCLFLAIVLFLAQILGSGAEENPFIAGGVPASDRDWTGKDYDAAVQAIQAGKAPLPVLDDPMGKQVFQRLINESNFGIYRNKSLPIGNRLGDYLQMQQSVNSIFKLYMARAGKGRNLHAEQAASAGFSLRVAALGVDLINEFVPTLPKDDTYEYRIQALKEAYGGLTTTFAASESTLGETKAFTAGDLSLILQAMRATLPTLKQAFSEEFKSELEKKLADRKGQFKGEDLAALDEMIKVLKADKKVASPAPVANEAKTARLKDMAVAYFKALTEGDIAKADTMVAAPFSHGGDEVLKTAKEIEARHKQVLVEKGKRKVPEYAVGRPEHAKPLDKTVFPDYEVFRIEIINTGYGVDIYVSNGDEPKVIGWADANK